MKKIILIFIAISASFFGKFSNAAPLEYLYEKCKYLELSHEFNSETIFWPGNDPFKFETVSKGNENGYFYSAFKFCTAEHAGTHLDAPYHFNENGQTVEQIPLEKFIGEAFVIDITKQCANNTDYALTISDIQNFEKIHGQIEKEAILIIRAGWGDRWPNRLSYMGSNDTKNASSLHFPGVSSEAAQWIAENRQIAVLGIDTASLDPGNSKDFQVHRILLGRNISFFENLRNVDQLPARGATIIALPMLITGGSGAPLRAFAVGWNGSDDPCKRAGISESASSKIGSDYKT